MTLVPGTSSEYDIYLVEDISFWVGLDLESDGGGLDGQCLVSGLWSRWTCDF